MKTFNFFVNDARINIVRTVLKFILSRYYFNIEIETALDIKKRELHLSLKLKSVEVILAFVKYTVLKSTKP